MAFTVTAEQRDALYDQILDRVSGIEDLGTVISSGDYKTAERLGWEYSDALRLVSEDLGWGEGPGGTVELKTPPDVLRRALTRLRDVAVARDASEQPERAELQESAERNRLVVEACQGVLADLDG